MQELTIFNYEGSEVRTVQKDGETWWVLKDVCKVLGLTNPTIVADRLDDDEKEIFKTKPDLGLDIPNRGVTVINESGLYNVIIRSDKPEAKKFKRWVTHKVLPTIRKHGAYMTTETLEKVTNDPDFLVGLLTVLKDERDERKRLEAKAEADKPKVLFAETVMPSSDTIMVGELAKMIAQTGINIGEHRLFKLLRDKGYLMKAGEKHNLPTQKSIARGLFVINERPYIDCYGLPRINCTTGVTPKGQLHIITLVKAENETSNCSTIAG